MSSATLDLSEVFTPVTRSSTLGMSQDERATAVNVHVLCLISLLLSSSSMWGNRAIFCEYCKGGLMLALFRRSDGCKNCLMTDLFLIGQSLVVVQLRLYREWKASIQLI